MAAALSDAAFSAMMRTRTIYGLFQKRRDVKVSSVLVVQIQLSIKVDTLQLLLAAINRIDEGGTCLGADRWCDCSLHFLKSFGDLCQFLALIKGKDLFTKYSPMSSS